MLKMITMLVSLEKIFRDENQPRKEFDPEKINELAQSIKWFNSAINFN